MTDEGLAALASRQRALQALNLSSLPKISSAGVAALLSANEDLREIDLSFNRQESENGSVLFSHIYRF